MSRDQQVTVDPASFRFEMVCEAVAPDGGRTRIGSYEISPNCLLCGESFLNDDFSTGTANVDGSTMATVYNHTGVLCAACTKRERDQL
jgi:hypothetical protein